MKLMAIIIVILTSIQFQAVAQISFVQDTIVATNSQDTYLEFEITDSDYRQEFEFDIMIDNPTMLYITKVEDNTQISSSEVTPLGDGYFTINISAKANLTNFRLEGKLLTGSDSITAIHALNLINSDYNFLMDSVILKNVRSDKSGVYIRFFESLPAVPNPLFSGETAAVYFYNDKATEIEFIFSDLKGYVYRTEKIFFEKGKNHYSVNTTDLAAGSYYLFIYTEMGNTVEQIVVVK